MSEFAITNILQNARDGITKGLVTLTYVHHKIHDGEAFYVEDFSTLSATQIYWAKLITPNTDKKCHITWITDANGMMETGLWEDAVGGMTGGTTKAPINHNRNSTQQSSVVYVGGCSSATAVGTTLGTWKVGVNIFKGSFGGEDDRDKELILKSNSTYLRMFKSGSTGMVVSFRAAWYEHAKDSGPKVAD